MGNLIGEHLAGAYELETARLMRAAHAAGALAGVDQPVEFRPDATQATVVQVVANHGAAFERFGSFLQK